MEKLILSLTKTILFFVIVALVALIIGFLEGKFGDGFVAFLVIFFIVWIVLYFSGKD